MRGPLFDPQNVCGRKQSSNKPSVCCQSNRGNISKLTGIGRIILFVSIVVCSLDWLADQRLLPIVKRPVGWQDDETHEINRHDEN